MKKFTIRCWCLLVGLIAIGCLGVQAADPVAKPAGSQDSAALKLTGETLQVSEKLTIEFTDVSTPPMPITQNIHDDGTISLPFNESVMAAGKTKSQISDAVHKALVPKYFKRLTVIIKTEDRHFYVGGEVRTPGRVLYAGEVTVTKAIQAAGDFTDFASRKNVELTRLNGERIIVNCKKALEDAKFDLPVYPGDKIRIRRSLY